MQLKRTSNIERRTSNIEVKSASARSTSTFGSTFDVRPYSRRQGFSFAEVMFAVVILGIGFIMVAAIFPVAIQQTQATGEENIAALAARDAGNGIVALPSTIPNPAYVAPGSIANYSIAAAANPAITIQYYPTFPPTVKNYILPVTPGAQGVVPPPAIVVPFDGTRWQLLQSHSIVVSDQRYAYVPFYRRENGSAAAELIVIAVTARNKPVYTVPNDALNAGQSGPALTPITLAANPNMGPALDPISATTGQPTQASSIQYTYIHPDTITTSGSYSEGWCAQTGTNSQLLGRTYRLGRGVSSYMAPPPGQTAAVFTQFEINPGDGMALTAGFDGNWGTANRITDATLPQPTCKFTSNTTLQPTVAYATLAATPDNPTGQITLYADASSANNPGNAVPGAFVIVADDFPFSPSNASSAQSADYQLLPNYMIDNPPYVMGSLNGRIFRLASVAQNQSSVGTGMIYNLDPAYGMRPTPTGGTQSPDTVPSQAMIDSAAANTSLGISASIIQSSFRIKVYIVGAGYVPNSTGTGGTYTGSAQDIGCFATYFPVK